MQTLTQYQADKTDIRALYQSLLHAPTHYLSEARHFLRSQLQLTAPHLADLPESPARLEAHILMNNARTARAYREYIKARRQGQPRRFFTNRAHALYFLRNVAPTKLVDGAWLYGVLEQWHDPRMHDLVRTYLEELGGMNMMIVHKDGHIETPSLTGNILPGVTRRSLIQLAQDKGHDVVETMIKLDDLLEDIKSGEVTEVFACGTAAIIAPIGRFKSERFDVTVAGGEPGELTMDLRNTLLGIQLGEIEDPHNWMWKVC